MKAIIFSIGESTTELCAEQMSKYFDVEVWQDGTTLWEKLKRFYEFNEDIVRIDADIIPNARIGEIIEDDGCWWHNSLGWDWYHQEVRPISIHFIKKPIFEIARKHIDEAENQIRPETYIWRLEEFHNPRVCHIVDKVLGMHGYAQSKERARIKALKEFRSQPYNWEFIEKIEAL